MNRLIYDTCNYNADLKQSTTPLSYMLDPIRYENCQKCRPELGIVGGTSVSHISGNLVDLENDLRGQTRPATRCPAYQYMPPTGDVLSSKEYIKPVTHPDIDISMKHLRPCQMQQFAEVPLTPTFQSYSCGQPRNPPNAYGPSQ
jgi:hypothetical protein